MSRPLGLAIAALFMFFSAGPVHRTFFKYRAIEAYEVRPGVMMMPTYSATRQICQVALERLHFSRGKVRLDSGLPRKEILQIFDELVPAEERGPRVKGFEGTLITRTGSSIVTTVEFENVSLEMYSEAMPTSGRSHTTGDDIVAIIRWKHRDCQ